MVSFGGYRALLRHAKGAVFVASLLGCATSPAFAAEPDAGWYADLDALWLQRDQGNNITLVDNRVGTTQVSSLTTHSVSYKLRTGGKLRIGRRYDAHNSVEAAFFTVQKWKGSASNVPGAATPSSAASVGISLVNMAVISRIDANFSSQLYSGEINMRHTLDSGATSFLGGIRYLQVPDNLTIQAVDIPSGITDTTSIATRNQLIGLQVGGEHDFNLGGGGFVFSAKGGVFLNMNKQSMVETTNAPSPPYLNGTLINFAGSQNSLASMLEAGARVYFNVNDHVSLQGGYQLMAIGGLALAPEQIALLGNAAFVGARAINGSAGTNHNGTMFLHGLYVGMNVRW
jgi:hypothetical protein